MSETKHTPGPWRTDYDGSLFGPNGESLLTGGIERPGEQDESSWVAVKREADARLVAAAPDMLAALQLVAHDVRSGSLPTNIQNAIESAIAKATGKP